MKYSLRRSGKIIKVEVIEAVELMEVTEKQLINSQTKHTQQFTSIKDQGNPLLFFLIVVSTFKG